MSCASYDAAGDMLCRSTSTTPSLSCWNGNTGGQQMGYDALRRLISWQNAPGSSPTASEQYAYDGEGNRVWQQAQSVSGSPSTTTTTYYYGGQLRIATAVNGPNSGKASLLDKILAGADLVVNVVMDVTSVVGLGEGLKAAYIGMKAGAHLVEDAAAHAGVDVAETLGRILWREP